MSTSLHPSYFSGLPTDIDDISTRQFWPIRPFRFYRQDGWVDPDRDGYFGDPEECRDAVAKFGVYPSVIPALEVFKMPDGRYLTFHDGEVLATFRGLRAASRWLRLQTCFWARTSGPANYLDTSGVGIHPKVVPLPFSTNPVGVVNPWLSRLFINPVLPEDPAVYDIKMAAALFSPLEKPK